MEAVAGAAKDELQVQGWDISGPVACPVSISHRQLAV